VESNWLEGYYEALEFFYWEPQHIFPKRDSTTELDTLVKIVKKASRVEDVKEHLRKMEVTLNHNIRQFFLLAPNALRNRLFKELFPLFDPHKVGRFDDAFVMHGSSIDAEFGLKNCMQPDFLFVSKAEVVSMEMKVNAKCDIDQVLKYALLGLAVETQQKVEKGHYLVLLAPGEFSEMFKERFESTEKLRGAIANQDLPSFLLNKPAPFREQPERLKQLAEQMRISFWNYERFALSLCEAKPPETDQSLGADVYRKLVDGRIEW